MRAVVKSRDPSVSKKPSEMDQYIGGRLRLWRRTMDVDANHLAERVGVTYQQLQKYEKGVNRISATRLFAISRELDVPIGYFYQDAEPPRGERTDAPDEKIQGIDRHALLSDGSGTDFLKCYVSIKDPIVRKALIKLMRSLTSESGSEPAG